MIESPDDTAVARSQDEMSQRSRFPEGVWFWVLRSLGALGLALSTYLSWHYLMGGSAIGCGGGSPCDQVLNSRWSAIGEVLPVSGLAAGAYLAILVASFSIGPTTPISVRRLAWRALLILAGAIAGSAVWFIIVQKWIIGAFCPYCTATHIIGLLLAALIIWQALKQFDGNSRRATGAFGLTSAGLAIAGLMVACQISFAPRIVYGGGQSQNTMMNPRAVPLVGSPDALHVVNLLFDYKCPHCQQMHFMLDEAIRRYSGKLAFALCPTPLNSQCNPYIPRDIDEFKDSCELAKVSLAVWLAKREAFPAFDHWMFSLESGDRWHPRSLDAARAKAVELVGQAKFDAALADPWIAEYLRTCIGLYGHTSEGGNNAVPKLVYGSRWIIVRPNDANDLVSILQDSLAVPKP